VTDTPPLEFDALVAHARHQADLTDFGADWFFEPLRVMLKATHQEARLSDAGKGYEAQRIVGCLVNRLRTIEAIKRHPEILDQEVTVAAAILGLSRTGSTKTHRMLCSAPGMTGLAWWEAQFPCPFPGEERGHPVARRAAAQQLLDLWLQTMPDLMSIHPMSLDQPDEEAILTDQFFIGTMVECFLWVPSYARWLETADQHLAYEELRTQLKFLQWQDPSREGKSWILKTPSHLSAPDVLLETFPGSVIVMTHRDPLKTIPSYCSMNATLMGMKSEHVPLHELGPFLSHRWSWMLNNLMALRDRIGDARFVDIQYQDLLDAPLEQARKIYARIGRDMTAADTAAIAGWLEENKREKWSPHIYDLETYGLSEDILKSDFAAYRAKYVR
jgi:hypothetical protein